MILKYLFKKPQQTNKYFHKIHIDMKVEIIESFKNLNNKPIRTFKAENIFTINNNFLNKERINIGLDGSNEYRYIYQD